MSESLFTASEREPARVLVAGGGVAALEAVLALRALAPSQLVVEVLAPNREFRAEPLSVAEPFGLAEPRRVDLAAFASEHGARFTRGALAEVDVSKRLVRTGTGEAIGFDALLVAIGATSRAALPGALTFRGSRDIVAFRELLEEIEAGAVRSVAFALPGPTRWSFPLYELALMTAARAAARDVDVRIEFVTHERAPLAAFGHRASDRVRGLLSDAGIRLRTSATPLVAQPGRLFLTNRGVIAAERVVALGKLSVADIPGLPQRRNGFIPTDVYGRVEGAPRVYAAGDASWFPIKQGGVAAQQADTAASAIAADAGIDVALEPFVPVLRGILLTGDAPQYLRADPAVAGEAAEAPLWSPAAKIAGRFLAPYIAGVDELSAPTLTDSHLQDAVREAEHQAALELALEAADAAAGWQDPQDALRWLRVAEGLNVALPMSYADKRREWSAAAALRLTTDGGAATENLNRSR